MSIAQDWLGQHDTNLWGGSGAGSGLGVGGVTNMRSMGAGTRRMGQPQWWEQPGFGAGAAAAVQQRPQYGPLFQELGNRSTFSNIDQSPIWTGEKINQQVAKNKADLGAQTEGNIKRQGQQFANSGFGAASPQQQALQQQMRMQARQIGTGQENDLRFGTAQANRQQIAQNQALRLQKEQAQADNKQRGGQMQQFAYGPLGKGEAGYSALTKQLAGYRPQGSMF